MVFSCIESQCRCTICTWLRKILCLRGPSIEEQSHTPSGILLYHTYSYTYLFVSLAKTDGSTDNRHYLDFKVDTKF